MTDSLHRFLFPEADVRGELVQLHASVEQALSRHAYPEPLAHLLGELMAAATLLAATLKLDGALLLQLQGSGVLRMVVVECTSERQIRATARWEGSFAQGQLRDWLQDGRFAVTLDSRHSQQLYQGIVPLEGDSVAEILENYLSRSEQLPTRLWLHSDGQQAAGLLLQQLPADASTPAEHEDWARLQQLAHTITPTELYQLAAQTVLHRLFHQETLRLFPAQDVEFGCTCSRERVAAMLTSLGAAEIESVLAEQGTLDIACEFCQRHYVFDATEAAALFMPPAATPSSAKQPH